MRSRIRRDDAAVASAEIASARVARCRSALWGERAGRAGTSMNDPGVISFAHGNGLRPPSPAVVQAGCDALTNARNYPLEKYNFLERFEPLEDAIRRVMSAEGLRDDHLTEICVDAGTTRLLLAFLSTVTAPGDIVLTAPTYYHGLAGWCCELGVGLTVAPTTESEAHKLTFRSLEQAQLALCRAHQRCARALILFNPTQTGAIYTWDELEEISEFCRRWDITVLEDAVFARTRFEPNVPMPRLALVAEMADHVITVDGCSKADNLANLRVGWAAGPEPMVRALEDFKTATTVGIPYVVLAMAHAALCCPPEERAVDTVECQSRATLVEAALVHASDALDADIRLEQVHPPAAGHATFVTITSDHGAETVLPGISNSVELCELLLDKAQVAVSPLHSSGLDGLEFRLNFAGVIRNGFGKPPVATQSRAAMDPLSHAATRTPDTVDVDRSRSCTLTDRMVADAIDEGIRQRLPDGLNRLTSHARSALVRT